MIGRPLREPRTATVCRGARFGIGIAQTPVTSLRYRLCSDMLRLL
jgi:hypothetical protein